MNRLRLAAVAAAGLLVATAAAHAAPPPPPGATPPPPPPAGAFPPPPPGAHVILDRQADGVVHVDVHCAEQETTTACAEIATKLLGQTDVAPAAK